VTNDWRDAVISGTIGGLMASMQLTMPATTALMFAQQLALASMKQGHPEWFTRQPDTSNMALVRNVLAAGLGWFLTAAVLRDPPHVYDGVPTPLRLR
jgi:hypothetical protein